MPIHCDHSRGPAFLLSRSDEATLVSLLELLSSQGTLTGRQVVGWFAAHAREQLEMTREEEELHRRRFPRALALIVKPDQFGALEVAIHAAAASGKGAPVRLEPTLAVEPLPIMRRSGQRRRAEKPKPSEPVVAEVAATVPKAAQPRPMSWRTPILAATALLGALLVSALAAHTFRTPAPIAVAPQEPPIEMLSLHAMHRPGRLVVSWNGMAAPIRYASRVTLVLHNGRTTTRRVLSRADARAGIQFFAQASPQVSASLVLETPNGAIFTEDTRVVNAGEAAPRASRVTPDMLPPGSGVQKF